MTRKCGRIDSGRQIVAFVMVSLMGAAASTLGQPATDTTAPANNLTLTGQYVNKDTARLYIGNLTSVDTNSVDTNSVDSMFIWYSLTTDTANFGDPTFSRGLSMREVNNAATSNQYQYP